MNTLCIVLLVSFTGYVRSVAVNGACGTGTPPPVCDDGLYCSKANVCIVKVKVDETCTTDPADQCIMGATCVSSMCKCMANHTANDDMTKCLLKIGENCTAAGSMCMMGTTCKEQTCMCPEKSGPNDDKNKCLMYVGGQCEESGDCVQGVNVVCTSSKCACTSNKYAPSDMMDMCKLKLNETCSADGDCGMNAMCSTGTPRKCACKENFTPTGNTCVSGSAAVVAPLFLLVAAFVTSRLMFTRDQ